MQRLGDWDINKTRKYAWLNSNNQEQEGQKQQIIRRSPKINNVISMMLNILMAMFSKVLLLIMRLTLKVTNKKIPKNTLCMIHDFRTCKITYHLTHYYTSFGAWTLIWID